MTTLSKSSMKSERTMPQWFYDYLKIAAPAEGDEFNLNGQKFVHRDGISRSLALLSAAQIQTEEAFGFKWKKRDTFDSPASLARIKSWLIERYGDLESAGWLKEHGENPILIDAGCGAGMAGLELFGRLIPNMQYIGVDISAAIDVAADRFSERGLQASFLQADISNLPFSKASVDLIFAEGVLHHTNSTKGALFALASLLKTNGRFMFYVYKRKGPVREYTDDYVRDRLQAMSPKEAWEAMEPLTQLGISLGELDKEIDIPHAIDVLGIPAGRINIQRLFYWHVAKVFYRPDLTFDEMNHINYDWYAPVNASRHSIEEVRVWCKECGLNIEREIVEDAGITIIAKKVE